MDQYKRGCCVKRLFMIQTCVSVSEVSLDSSCAVGRYGSVFKKRSKTLRDHKRLVRLWRVVGWPPPPTALHTNRNAHTHILAHTQTVAQTHTKKCLDPSCHRESIVLVCGKENFVALTPVGERKSKNGDSGGYDLRLQTLCGLWKWRLLAHLKFCTLLCQR